MRHRLLLLLASLALADPAASPEAGEGAFLTLGETREAKIAGSEVHAYRVAAADLPVVVVVEQRGIDLAVEARGPGPTALSVTDTLNGRWGLELVLLPAGGAGEQRRVEVHPGERDVAAGRYTIRTEALSTATAEEAQRSATWEKLGQAGRWSAGTPEERGQARALYRDLLPAWRDLGDRRAEAETLSSLAFLEQKMGEPGAAIEHGQRGLALWRELGDAQRQATVLSLLGAAHWSTGDLARARQALAEANALFEGAGERLESAASHGSLCLVEQRSGRYQEALACYDELLALFRELGDKGQEARILNSLGGVHDILGDPAAALDHYRQALALHHALGDRRGEAETLSNMGVVHRALGEWQEALRLYGDAREILAPLDERALQAALLNNLGYTYLDLGEPQLAVSFFEDALHEFRRLGDRLNEVIALRNLGLAWRRLEEPKKALAAYGESRRKAAVLGDSLQGALTRLALGHLELYQDDPAAALREIEPALDSLRQAGHYAGEIQALVLRATALSRSGRSEEALADLQKALAQSRAQGDRGSEAVALYELAAEERRARLATAAEGHTGEAVALLEELRTRFVGPSLRAAFLGWQRNAWSLRIDLHMDRHAADPKAGHDRAALEASEQGRARSLLDALYSGPLASGGSAAPATLWERRRALRGRLASRIDHLQREREEAPGEKADAVLRREIADLLAQLDGVEAEIRRQDPGYAARSQPPPMTAAQIAGQLDPGTLLLEYWLGRERSYLWVVGAAGVRSFRLPPRREIEALAQSVLEELSQVEIGAGRTREKAAALSRLLLEPVWSEAASARRLVVVPDGALHLLPFGAFPVPDPGKSWDGATGKPLLEHMEVTYLPSATTLALERQRRARRPRATRKVAVFADPVFSLDDPRFDRLRPTLPAARPGPGATRGTARWETGGLYPSFDPLPASRREAEAIAGLVPAAEIHQALGFEATRQAALSGELRPFGTLHFATHAVADTRNPELSGLMLSLVDAAGRPREGFVGLSDVYELDLAADLVVLSGCQTALGKEVRGEGLMGLTRGFLYAGVPRVVASLWRVQDRSTAELMSRFYRAMWQGGHPPAAALREAQLALRRDPRYRHPYYWAGFVLQGDWR